MLIVSHPTGNTFVRATLRALEEQEMLHCFHTTIALRPGAWQLKMLPRGLRDELERRTYATKARVVRHPGREAARLAASRLGWKGLARHEAGWASVDAVYQDMDRRVARSLRRDLRREPRAAAVSGVYCYEDGALRTFEAARELGLRRFYDLPIAHWKTIQSLLEEEAQRWPEWEPTLVGTRDSQAKRERKDRELELADVVFVPSLFVRDSLPEHILQSRDCCVAEFGSPPVLANSPADAAASTCTGRAGQEGGGRALRVLFAGSMSQRKGLADAFAAMRLLDRSDVELVVMGSPVAPMEFYRRQLPGFRYEAPRPHAQVLELMQSCDVLLLPSIAEGRALVQQEALACGLPLIVTPNTGGQDLIEEGRTGFLVPIRAPETIAHKIDWLASHRDVLPAMRLAARAKALEYSWEDYGRKIVRGIRRGLADAGPGSLEA